MQADLIRRADWVLSKCGRPTMPSGMTAVYLRRDILVQDVLGVNSSRTITKEVEGETAWVLRAISGFISNSVGLYIQVLLPNGRFLLNQLQDVIQFTGFGSGRFVLTRELECPPGSKIQITIDDTIPGVLPPTPQSVDLLFEGHFKYLVRNGAGSAGDPFVSSEPRYLGHTNQNILAPSWMQGYYPETPPGCEDTPFVYSSLGVTFNVTGPFADQDEIQIEETSEFLMTRMFFLVTASSQVTAGTFLVRIRAASGYALYDDYVRVKYVQGVSYGIEWKLRPAENVIFDLILVDAAQSSPNGTLTFEAFMEGVRRKRKV